jgi:hypothetical protein
MLKQQSLRHLIRDFTALGNAVIQAAGDVVREQKLHAREIAQCGVGISRSPQVLRARLPTSSSAS